VKSSIAQETHSDRELALRFGADRLCLWCLCASAACRRARACRGDVHACSERIADWLKAVDAERLARPDFESIETLVRTPADLRAYRAWRRALSG